MTRWKRELRDFLAEEKVANCSNDTQLFWVRTGFSRYAPWDYWNRPSVVFLRLNSARYDRERYVERMQAYRAGNQIAIYGAMRYFVLAKAELTSVRRCAVVPLP